MTRREFLFGRRKFMDDQSGATAIEYGLIAALVSVAFFLPLRRSGLWIERKFYCIRAAIQGFEPAAPCSKGG
ncbi:MAG: Flp family type IVb pilin [Brucellaceae bacterium]|nr:Flp family type IVb pilin [Notoacmeibacter sp.]MCC0028090.1 Flp family type IVb pilin [Brucellaceae bacterium]